jgi:Protein of unknown function (DUF550).
MIEVLRQALEANLQALESGLNGESDLAQQTRHALALLVSEGEESESMAAYLREQIDWSTKTFGESKRTLGITRHIRKELAEVEAQPNDLSEWIDVIILALDGYWRHGGTPQTIMRDLTAKANINHGRVYPKQTSDTEPSEHIREDETP